MEHTYYKVMETVSEFFKAEQEFHNLIAVFKPYGIHIATLNTTVHEDNKLKINSTIFDKIEHLTGKTFYFTEEHFNLGPEEFKKYIKFCEISLSDHFVIKNNLESALSYDKDMLKRMIEDLINESDQSKYTDKVKAIRKLDSKIQEGKKAIDSFSNTHPIVIPSVEEFLKSKKDNNG